MKDIQSPTVKVVDGGIFVDERGKITHCNNLDMIR